MQGPVSLRGDDAYAYRLSIMSQKELHRFKRAMQPPLQASFTCRAQAIAALSLQTLWITCTTQLVRYRWWYCRAFAKGLLLLDEMNERVAEEEFEYTMELVLSHDALAPSAFIVGFKDALCTIDLPPEPEVTLRQQRQVSQSSAKVISAKVISSLHHPLPYVQEDKAHPLRRQLDEIRYFSIGRGWLAIV